MNEHGGNPAQAHDRGEVVDQNRRRFWRSLLGRPQATPGGTRDASRLSLESIGDVPDDILVEMVPVWMDGISVEVRPDGVYRLAGNGKAVRIHAFLPHERAVVDQYACGRNLGDIADCLAQDGGIGHDRAFQTARSVFVGLCRMGVCRPAAAHLPTDGHE